MITEGYLCGKLEELFRKVSEYNAENNMECNAEDTKGSSEKEISDVNADGTLKYNKTHTVCALDVKALLKYIQFDDPMAVFDAGVAAYLLNPLKSSYTYDDMAKEYLSGRILPAREELLGKLLGSMQSPIANFARVLNQIAEQNGGADAAAAE